MSIINILFEHESIVSMLSEIFTAVGTVGAVIVALWLSYKDNKPKLRVNATVGIITPEMKEHLWLSCVNTGKLPITCTGFVFNPFRFRPRKLRVMPKDKCENSIKIFLESDCNIKY